MKINKKSIECFLIFIATLSILSMLRIFKSGFNPALTGYFFGFCVAVLLLVIYLYEVYFLGDGYSKGTLKNKKPGRFLLHSIHFFAYWIFGIYGVSEYGNALFGSTYLAPKHAYLLGETGGTKGSRCRYSMVLVDISDTTNRQRYCSYNEEYVRVKKIEPMNKYDRYRIVNVIYKRSFLGSELIKLEY